MGSNVLTSTIKPVLSGHTNIDKTKVLKTNGSLIKVESIVECSLGAFCNTLTCIKRQWVLKTNFCLFEWQLKTGYVTIVQYNMHIGIHGEMFIYLG